MKADTALVDTILPSPNFGARAEGTCCELVILHYTGMTSGQAALEWLVNPAAQVSAHYLVWENGRIVQLVPEACRAWHAGVSAWHGDTDINSRSIGIELVNAGHPGGLPPFPRVQLEALIALTQGILRRHPVAPPAVLAHSDVAPGRKCDPGEAFPWEMLHHRGIGHWVEPALLVDSGDRLGLGAHGAAVTALQQRLARYGYRVEVSGAFDAGTRCVVEAFQRHFRPQRVDGTADASTIDTLDRLLAALPRSQARVEG